MNGGLKILIARMETHPEEFENDSKWISSFNNYKKYMTEEEKDVFWKKLCELKMSEFEKKIVKRLMQEEEPEEQLTLDLNSTHKKTVLKQVDILRKLQGANAVATIEDYATSTTTLGRLHNYT